MIEPCCQARSGFDIQVLEAQRDFTADPLRRRITRARARRAGQFAEGSRKQLARLAATAGDINDNIRRLGEIVGTQLQASVEKAVSAFQSRIEQVCQEMVSRAAKRLTETAQNSTVELAKQAPQLVEGEMSEFFNNALRRFDRSSGGSP